ncbi:hypothetical protein [Actinomadura rudentiformis]|uniref:Uncharacterized protein n=1 Tax=Actinomadura rudentiformis TaxID=359158 RepID=A0A6H9YZM0_9ACTN|nr:hypothetical protein [Actinomadura rudentiformis]KAB2349744.1 hypothetical protein F8566_13480 [Actinomadura rudentiformis]
MLASAVTPPPGGQLAALATVLGVFAAVVRNLPAAVLTAVVAWSFYLGFLGEEAGEPSWHGAIDLLRLGMLILAVPAGSAHWLIRNVLTRPESGLIKEIESWLTSFS